MVLVADRRDEGSAEQSGPRGEPAAEPSSPEPRRKRVGKSGEPHVSNALRTAYQATVQEDIPAEFLDLLGKLA